MMPYQDDPTCCVRGALADVNALSVVHAASVLSVSFHIMPAGLPRSKRSDNARKQKKWRARNVKQRKRLEKRSRAKPRR